MRLTHHGAQGAPIQDRGTAEEPARGLARLVARLGLVLFALLPGAVLPASAQTVISGQESNAAASAGATDGVGRTETPPAYEFASPPSVEANRVYGVNRQTGEMSVCQFERPEGHDVGITRCFVRGEGAGPQDAGDYALVATRFAGETGIFRVNRATGAMSICYVRDFFDAAGKIESRIQCTAQAR